MARETENAFLRERLDVSEALAIFRVAPRDGPVPEFEPGQFTNLGLRIRHPAAGESFSRRAFSIASSPRVRDHFELYVRLVGGGELTPALFEVRQGEGVWLDTRVHGRFTLADIPAESRVLMVATGTGLAPFVSMLRTYQGRERWRRCVLLESASTSSDLGYRAELERIARADPTISYHPTLTREPETSTWQGLRGRVQTLLQPERFGPLAGEPLDPLHWRVLLCGNPAMIASVTDLLAGQGFRLHRRRQPGQVHTERYW